MSLVIWMIVPVVLWLFFKIVHMMKHRHTRVWLKKMQCHTQQFKKIFNTINGFTISKHARSQRDAPEYCYGEIEFIPFIALLSLCRINSETVFYDLGSGVGKAVIACAMIFDIKQCVGVELFEELHQAALIGLENLKTLPAYREKAQKIVFIRGDLREVSLNEANLIFINASAFFTPLWNDISRHCEQLISGALVISASKPLLSKSFKLQKQTHVEMSWGVVTAYIQIRI